LILADRVKDFNDDIEKKNVEKQENVKQEIIFDGIKISEGIAIGKVCLFNQNLHSNLTVQKIEKDQVENEKKRLEVAIKKTSVQLIRIIKDIEERVGLTESKIFVAQKMILEDPVISMELLEDIAEFAFNAEGAVIRIFDKYESRLLKVEDEYIQSRAMDISEIKRRILDMLSDSSPHFQCTGSKHCRRGKNRIIVSSELTPGLTIGINTKQALGFVTEHGGKLSHAAILAKALGIPAVSGIKEINQRVLCGTDILIDGNLGRVIVWPTEETIRHYMSQPGYHIRKAVSMEPVKKLRILANINLSLNVIEAEKMKAEGIGLYRTEFEFLARNKILSEVEQYNCYARVVKKMEGKPVVFRLLDIGGDKAASFFNLPEEENPYLGFRGSRLLLARNDLLETQARAMARTSQIAPIHVLYPMIVDLNQFLKIKEAFCNAIAGMEQGEIKHGIMFEVPSACLQAQELLKHADFASIGSNDLIQYLFAVDRNNERVAYDFSPDRPVFWELLKKIARAASLTGKPLSLCGEMAGNIEYLPRILKTGITTISVSPRLISEIRLYLQQEQ